jgi:hypothetical protein
MQGSEQKRTSASTYGFLRKVPARYCLLFSLMQVNAVGHALLQVLQAAHLGSAGEERIRLFKSLKVNCRKESIAS